MLINLLYFHIYFPLLSTTPRTGAVQQSAFPPPSRSPASRSLPATPRARLHAANSPHAQSPLLGRICAALIAPARVCSPTHALRYVPMSFSCARLPAIDSPRQLCAVERARTESAFPTQRPTRSRYPQSSLGTQPCINSTLGATASHRPRDLAPSCPASQPGAA